MRGKLLVGMMLAVTVFSLAGCGVKEKKEVKTKKVSVSEDSGRTLEEQKEALFKADLECEALEMTLSKNYLYSSNHDGYITQWNRKGEKVSSTRKDGYVVNACSDKRLICSKYIAKKEQVEIYSIPIKQTESGERVQWEKEEKVASSDIAVTEDVYLCEPYLVYAEDDTTLTRLNLETKEKKKMQFDIDMEMAWTGHFSIIDGLLYLVDWQSDEERVYCIRIDDWTSEKLYEDKTEGEIGDICVDGQFLYVLIDARRHANGKIIRYDIQKRKVDGQLSFEKIGTLLQKEGVAESVDTKYIGDDVDLFVYKGRLYLSMNDVDIKTKTRKEYGRWALLSCSTEGMTDLKYERDVSEWCYENSSHYSESDGSIEYDCVNFWQTYGDEFYFIFVDKQKDKEQLMCYHLDTKKWEKVPENNLVCRAAREAGYVAE